MKRYAAFSSLLSLIALLVCESAGAATILVLGDSISAGYGIEQEQGWVHLLGERLQKQFSGSQVINASISGDTTAGGLARLPIALERHDPDIVIIELGGNDGLRGYPVTRIRENLSQLIEFAESSDAQVILVGMKIPPNYGKRYADAFHAVFGEVAQEHATTYVPFLLEDVATTRSLMQQDGIHPTAEAQPLLLDRLWPALVKLLESR